MSDQRPVPRFAVGQMVLCHTIPYGWVGPLAASAMCYGDSDGGTPTHGWFYALEPLVPMCEELKDGFRAVMPSEFDLRPYDPPADQSYAELMAGLRTQTGAEDWRTNTHSARLVGRLDEDRQR